MVKVVTNLRFSATLIVKAFFLNAKKEEHMKLSKFLTLTLAVVVIFAGAVPAIAGDFDGMGQRHWERPGFAGLKTFLKLDLTDAQKSQLINIIDKYQTERRAAAHNFFKARRDFFRAMHGKRFDEANLRKAFEQVSSIEENAFVLRAKMISEMKGVLTPEQISLLEKQHRGSFERIKHRHHALPEAQGN
jgi:periplasmic protein CpxP/Spy